MPPPPPPPRKTSPLQKDRAAPLPFATPDVEGKGQPWLRKGAPPWLGIALGLGGLLGVCGAAAFIAAMLSTGTETTPATEQAAEPPAPSSKDAQQPPPTLAKARPQAKP